MSQVEPVKKAYRFKTKSEDYVYIGDPEDAEFHPKLKLNRWGKECFLKFFFDDSKIKDKSCKCEMNKVKWETKDFGFHFYPVEPRTVTLKYPQTGEVFEFLQNELGGLEFEIILKKKPASNQFVFAIETQVLKFYYQPPLHPDHPTWADTDGDGIADSFRPENVVGSYAVYHARRTDMHRSKADAEKYKVGKAFHIYRPKVTDASGNSTWADLNIDEAKGLLTITIPQEFLDGAVYPVVVDPTFGYETIGGSAQSAGDRITGSVFTITESGTGDSISYYVVYVGTTSKAAVYKHSDSSLVGETEQITTSYNQWNTFNFVDSPSFTANTEYVLVGWSAGSYMKYDSGEIDQGHYQSLTYNSFPDPATFTHEDRVYSIYCTYTTAAPPPPPLPPANPLISKPLESPQEVSKPLIR